LTSYLITSLRCGNWSVKKINRANNGSLRPTFIKLLFTCSMCRNEFLEQLYAQQYAEPIIIFRSYLHHIKPVETAVLFQLESMGYGEGTITGKTGDGGIDGIVYQNKLGLGTIISQAKRFNTDNKVTASMLRDFVGTLDLNGVETRVMWNAVASLKEATKRCQKTQKHLDVFPEV